MSSRALILLALFYSTSAQAAGIADIPEPSNMALMALGIVGMVIGRRAARSRSPHEDRSAKD